MLIYKDQNVEVNAMCHGNYGKSNWKKTKQKLSHKYKEKKEDDYRLQWYSQSCTHTHTDSFQEADVYRPLCTSGSSHNRQM